MCCFCAVCRRPFPSVLSCLVPRLVSRLGGELLVGRSFSLWSFGGFVAWCSVFGVQSSCMMDDLVTAYPSHDYSLSSVLCLWT